MNPSCEDFSNSGWSMKFLYFNIEKGGKLYNLNVELGTISRPILSATLGGKTKKHKNKKSRKNKKIKITKRNKPKNTKKNK